MSGRAGFPAGFNQVWPDFAVLGQPPPFDHHTRPSCGADDKHMRFWVVSRVLPWRKVRSRARPPSRQPCPVLWKTLAESRCNRPPPTPAGRGLHPLPERFRPWCLADAGGNVREGVEKLLPAKAPSSTSFLRRQESKAAFAQTKRARKKRR